MTDGRCALALPPSAPGCLSFVHIVAYFVKAGRGEEPRPELAPRLGLVAPEELVERHRRRLVRREPPDRASLLGPPLVEVAVVLRAPHEEDAAEGYDSERFHISTSFSILLFNAS